MYHREDRTFDGCTAHAYARGCLGLEVDACNATTQISGAKFNLSLMQFSSQYWASLARL